jgi:alkylmercury lyase
MKGRKPMSRLSLNEIASHLAAQLHCTQEILCRQILQTIADAGQPVAPTRLAATLQMSQDELHTHLVRLPDTEFDQHGNIVGWGVTLLPTSHRFQIQGRQLFTWCAFDTVLFPPLLQVEAQVQSTCPVTGHPITFVTTPKGIVKDLTPASSVMSLILPARRSDCVRGTFCVQSFFFRSEQAASSFLTDHPEAILLSVEEAACVGRLVAQNRLTGAS